MQVLLSLWKDFLQSWCQEQLPDLINNIIRPLPRSWGVAPKCVSRRQSALVGYVLVWTGSQGPHSLCVFTICCVLSVCQLWFVCIFVWLRASVVCGQAGLQQECWAYGLCSLFFLAQQELQIWVGGGSLLCCLLHSWPLRVNQTKAILSLQEVLLPSVEAEYCYGSEPILIPYLSFSSVSCCRRLFSYLSSSVSNAHLS